MEQPIRSPKEAREYFRANGINISEWSRERGFNRYTIVDLLRGKRVGHRGEAHRAAVALGLKLTPNYTTKRHKGRARATA